MELLKKKFVATNEIYDQEKSSLLYFLFPSSFCANIDSRLKKSSVIHKKLNNQHVYCIDGFFDLFEADVLAKFSAESIFSDLSYGTLEAAALGEKPSMTLNAQERWNFFIQPPNPIKVIYSLFSHLARVLDIEISTMPWMLFNGIAGSCAVIANKVLSVKQESTIKGKHKDVDPTKKLAFETPCLYGDKPFTGSQINGQTGYPYYLTVMVYSNASNFNENYEMGTSFFFQDGKMIQAICRNMRIVIFEGDIFHSIGASNFSEDIDTWRVSYVFKIILNPKSPTQNIVDLLMEFFKNQNYFNSNQSYSNF